MSCPITYKAFGDAALLVEWPAKLDEEILDDVLALDEALQEQQEILETIQSVNSITVLYDVEQTTYMQLTASIRKIYLNLPSSKPATASIWKLPVCYDPGYGLDLEELSKFTGLSGTEITRIHSESTYVIYAIGFLPGFLYLGGLDQRLYVDRKAQPRMEIIKGAVGIGGSQTGIYPSASPGGWQIIGNCPVPLFDPGKEVPCFAKPGDRVQFVPVSMEEHQSILARIEEGAYKLEKEVLND